MTLAACGGDGDETAVGQFPPDTTCGVAFTLGGALDVRLAPSRSSTACGTQTSFESGIDAGFVLVDGQLAHIDLIVAEVLEGETGTFPAELRLVHEDGREWRGDCVADIAEHEHVGPAELGWESYRVRGDVTCEGPALEADGAGSALEIEALSRPAGAG